MNSTAPSHLVLRRENSKEIIENANLCRLKSTANIKKPRTSLAFIERMRFGVKGPIFPRGKIGRTNFRVRNKDYLQPQPFPQAGSQAWGPQPFPQGSQAPGSQAPQAAGPHGPQSNAPKIPLKSFLAPQRDLVRKTATGPGQQQSLQPQAPQALGPHGSQAPAFPHGSQAAAPQGAQFPPNKPPNFGPQPQAFPQPFPPFPQAGSQAAGSHGSHAAAFPQGSHTDGPQATTGSHGEQATAQGRHFKRLLRPEKRSHGFEQHALHESQGFAALHGPHWADAWVAIAIAATKATIIILTFIGYSLLFVLLSRPSASLDVNQPF